ncbi:MAG: hypothetical protein AAFX06_10215 [Planctomycetota bacterium]
MNSFTELVAKIAEGADPDVSGTSWAAGDSAAEISNLRPLGFADYVRIATIFLNYGDQSNDQIRLEYALPDSALKRVRQRLLRRQVPRSAIQLELAEATWHFARRRSVSETARRMNESTALIQIYYERWRRMSSSHIVVPPSRFPSNAERRYLSACDSFRELSGLKPHKKPKSSNAMSQERSEFVAEAKRDREERQARNDRARNEQKKKREENKREVARARRSDRVVDQLEKIRLALMSQHSLTLRAIELLPTTRDPEHLARRLKIKFSEGRNQWRIAIAGQRCRDMLKDNRPIGDAVRESAVRTTLAQAIWFQVMATKGFRPPKPIAETEDRSFDLALQRGFGPLELRMMYDLTETECKKRMNGDVTLAQITLRVTPPR